MTTGPEDGRRPIEPTFADVMNGFSFDSGRGSRRRRWGRHRGEDQAAKTPREANVGVPVPDSVEWPIEAAGHDQEYADAGAYRHDDQVYAEPVSDRPADAGSAAVRPYAWTRGRTRSGYHMEIETLVTTSQRGHDELYQLQFEHRSVAELCERARSVAEVAALLAVPLGVAKVLLGDMAGLGLVAVHQSVSGNGDVPDLALMERVLSGLRRL